MEKICSHERVSRIITGDPVRPHIDAETRLAPGREIYHIDYLAFLCLAYTDHVPIDEEDLLSSKVGNIVVAYTVWSNKRGLGRKIILDIYKTIQNTQRFNRLVTLSPKTEMAMKLHLSNGAKLISENPQSNNFENLISSGFIFIPCSNM